MSQCLFVVFRRFTAEETIRPLVHGCCCSLAGSDSFKTVTVHDIPFMTELTRVRPKLLWMVMLEAMMKQKVLMKRKLAAGLVARLLLCLDDAHR